jgi:hypothetical protein
MNLQSSGEPRMSRYGTDCRSMFYSLSNEIVTHTSIELAH